MQMLVKGDVSQKLIKEFSWYYDNKYITPRDGNACVALSSEEFLITASGVAKQTMQENMILSIDAHGHPINPEKLFKPSIETGGHLQAMKIKNLPVSVHVHSMNTVALFSLATKRGFLTLLEDNFRHHWPELFRYTQLGPTIPYLAPGSQALHEAIEHSLKAMPSAHILVLDRHGILTLGESLTDCKEHIQRLEHVSTMTLNMLMASNGDINILK